MKCYERFLKYVSFESTSNEESSTCPSTNTQLVLAHEIAKDMKEIGISDVEVTADGYSKSMDIDCTEKFATDENGDYFIICSIWQIPEEAYGTVLTAKAYFEVDGVRYYAQETSYSVITLAAAYLENSIYSTLSENAQGAITAFNAQLA